MGPAPGHPAHCTETRLYCEVIKKDTDAPSSCMHGVEGWERGSARGLCSSPHGLRCGCPAARGAVCALQEGDRQGSWSCVWLPVLIHVLGQGRVHWSLQPMWVGIPGQPQAGELPPPPGRG